MCKRCLKLELQSSLFTLSAHIAKMWASKANQAEHFAAVQRVRAAQQALENADRQLQDHQRFCPFIGHTRAAA